LCNKIHRNISTIKPRPQIQIENDQESKKILNDLKNESEGNNSIKITAVQDKKIPGIYSKEERAQKILGYKNKIMKWRNKHPVSRAFSGRSVTAVNKPRVKGKFVSAKIQKDSNKEKNNNY